MILRFLSERAGPLGRIVIGLLGIAWNLATYLAVPVLVSRNMGPIDTVKESAALFKKTWGEQVAGNFGMGWIFFLAFFAWAAIGTGLIVGSAALLPVSVIPAVGAVVLGFIVLALVSSALRGVYAAALYQYATTGESAFYDQRILGNAFRPK
jgi:hypothetical protein